MLFAIVDIETTGSYAAGSGITEIAIVVHDGKEILNTFETLVNPKRPIPFFIQNLTGITEEMVANAPTFDEIAPTVAEILADKIFVAHNVNFDYSFVKYHLEQAGFSINGKKLCTVRLARKIIPGLPSYSLGKLTHSLRIPHTQQHRAAGDAIATALLFGMLTARDERNEIAIMLHGKNKEQYLPPNVSVAQIDALPETPGVYYFYNAAGKTIYIGKAINIRQRVKSHFSNNKPGKQKQDFLRDIYRISHQPQATELMAHIFEATEIRKTWPLYNKSQKGYQPKFGIFVYEDRQGFLRLALEKNKHYHKPLYTFDTLTEGRNWIIKAGQQFGLCARLCNISTATCLENEQCNDWGCCAHEGTSQYNKQVQQAVHWYTEELPTFIIIDKGRKEGEESCILIINGVFCAMGYLNGNVLDYSLIALKEYLTPYNDNDYIRSLIYKYKTTNPENCFVWDAQEKMWNQSVLA